MRLLVKALAGLWVLGLAFGCESIAGIEDRTFVAPVKGSPECEAYCSDVLLACKDNFAAYSTRDTCILTCEEFPRGEVNMQNTLECRAQQAKLALDTKEPAAHCSSAAQYGSNRCGTACEAYCSLWNAFCPNDASQIKDCVSACEAIPQKGGFSLASGEGGDTLECRLARLPNAALDPATECPNVALLPRALCNEPLDKEANCEHYCQVVGTACTGGLAVFEDKAQCMAVCGALPKGDYSHTVENTVGCRIYHAYNSLRDAPGHCSHSGPGGDGHCGLDLGATLGSCESYCMLLEKACKADFDGSFANQSECLTDCASLGDSAKADDGYDVGSAATKPMQCRLLNVSRALTEPTACEKAMGTGCPAP